MAKLIKQDKNKKRAEIKKVTAPDIFSLAIKSMILGVIFIVPVIFAFWYKGGYELFSPIKLFFTQVPLIVALFVLALSLFYGKDVHFIKNPINICVFSFLTASVLSLVSTFNLFISLNDIFRLLFYIIFYFFFVNYIRSKKDIKLSLTVVFSAFTLVIFYAVLQRMGFDLLAAASGRMGVDSTLGNPDFFAGYLISLIPLIFSCIFLVKREWRVPLAILALAGVVFLFMTQSRAGFLGLFFSFLLFTFFVLRKKETKKEAKIWTISFVCITVLLLLVLSFKGSTAFTRIKENLDLKSTNIRFRLLSYGSTLNIIKKYPITGTGTGTFYNVYPKYRLPQMKEVFTFVETPKYTHNDFLQIASETGIVGLLAFLWILFVFFRQGLKIIGNSSEDPDLNWIAIGSVCSLAGMLVQMVFDFNFYRPETALNFWMLIALVSTMSATIGENEKAKKLFIPKKFSKITATFLFVACFFLFWYSFSVFMGNVHYNKGLRLEKISDVTSQPEQKNMLRSKAVDEFKKAISNDKVNDAYYTQLGTFYGNISNEYQQITDDQRKQYMLAAISNFEQTLRLCPFYAGSHYNLGQACLFYALAYDKNYMARSEQELKNAISLSSFSEAEFFHNQLGLLYKERGMADQAIFEYQEALKINPKTIQSLINLGNVYYARSWFDKAEEVYFKALEIDPNNPDALNNLANTYYQKKMFDRAIEQYKKVITVNPGYFDAYNNLGSVYYVRGMYQQARQEFNTLLQIAPNAPQANYARSMLSRMPQ